MFAPEKPLHGAAPTIQHKPFFPPGDHDGCVTLIILGIGLVFTGRTAACGRQPGGFFGYNGSDRFPRMVTVLPQVYISAFRLRWRCRRQNPSFTWWVINRLAFLIGSTNSLPASLYFIKLV